MRQTNSTYERDFSNRRRKALYQKEQRKEWLEKMKADRQAGTGAYAIKQGGQNVAQYPNQQPPLYNRQQEQYKKQMGMNAGTGWTTVPSGQQTDPYQLPQRPQFSSVNGVGMNPGQPQISTVGPQNAADINPYGGPRVGPRPQQPPFAPGQQAYNGPAIAPMGRPPQSAFGQQNPVVFNQNFAQSPYGQSQMPYQPHRAQWQPPQQQQWGY